MSRGFDHSSPEDAIHFIKENLGRHTQFALATVDGDGKPWVVCVNLAFDEHFNVIWKSEKTTEHSKHIQNDPNVALCVFSQTEIVGDFGFYAKAVAHEVTDPDELAKIIKIRFEDKGKPAPAISEFIGESNTRLYLAELKEAWLNDDVHEKIKVDLSRQ